jgi:hypothetical protein
MSSPDALDKMKKSRMDEEFGAGMPYPHSKMHLGESP